MNSLTLRARCILPIGSGPIENGWIRIQCGRIAAIGRRQPPGTVHDLGDAIILPGLVNAHTHLEFSDLETPLAAVGGLPGWIQRVVQLRRSRPVGRTEDNRLSKALRAGLLESAVAGVTTVGEIATGVVPNVYTAAGPRVSVYRESLGFDAAAMNAAHGSLVRDIDRLTAGGCAAGISPHAPYSVAAALGKKLLGIARHRQLPVAMHLAESCDEHELLANGTGPFRRLLEDLGVWDAGAAPRLLSAADWITQLAQAPRGMVVHGTFLNATDHALERLARHRDRLCVVVCPRTTQLISGLLPPLALFRRAGIRLAIGTDSRASNPDLSLLAECRTLVAAGLASPTEVLTMATRNGAWGLMQERCCGVLHPGRRADLVILRPTATALRDPLEAVLDPTTRIETTLRSGRIIAGTLLP